MIIFWAIIFFTLTNGFNHFTQASYRQYQINQQQPKVSFVKLMDAEGNKTDLATLAQTSNKTLIVEFIYTRCNALCLSLGSIFQQTQKQILTHQLQNKIGLVSVSFDVDRETRQTLQAYGARFDADQTIWQIATMESETVLNAVKEKLGLVVIQDEQKNLIHNSAFMVVNKQGHVVGLFEPSQISQAIELALKQTTLKDKALKKAEVNQPQLKANNDER